MNSSLINIQNYINSIGYNGFIFKIYDNSNNFFIINSTYYSSKSKFYGSSYKGKYFFFEYKKNIIHSFKRDLLKVKYLNNDKERDVKKKIYFLYYFFNFYEYRKYKILNMTKINYINSNVYVKKPVFFIKKSYYTIFIFDYYIYSNYYVSHIIKHCNKNAVLNIFFNI